MGILDSINYHVKVEPSGGGSVYKQTVTYNCKGAEKPSEDFLKKEKELYEKTYKAIEDYAVAHPEIYNQLAIVVGVLCFSVLFEIKENVPVGFEITDYVPVE